LVLNPVIARDTARTVGLFVGRPVERIDADGRAFRTALPRAPAAGPVLATALGLVGDAVANTRVHGGPERALCVYPARHYAAWRAEGGERFSTAPAFGENLCVDGLDEDSVCVDDIYAVGGARVQVAAPRAPCTKVARFHAWPGLYARMRDEARCGFYLRVLTPGWLAVGDTWTLEARTRPEETIRRAHEVAFASELNKRV